MARNTPIALWKAAGALSAVTVFFVPVYAGLRGESLLVTVLFVDLNSEVSRITVQSREHCRISQAVHKFVRARDGVQVRYSSIGELPVADEEAK